MSFNIIFKTLAGRNVQPGFEWSLFLSLLLNKFNYTNFKDTYVFAQQSLYASHVNFPIVSEQPHNPVAPCRNYTFTTYCD